MKALVVDDSSVMRKILIGALGHAGISEVGEAADGEEAVAKVEKEDFNLVLMDWNMPRMTGIDALKAMRAAGKKVPIIMVTTEAEKSRILDAIKSGASNYVIKPFDTGTIVAKVKEVLAKASA